ncbi:MAG: flagellar hook-length control protein FliK [Bacteroidetes bacterium]|nr:flagellar hook-length control protein FliK [Bacteroidota bacterium]
MMQFNPIFLPSNPITNISNGNNIKAFENAKYLFSDLVKVEGDVKPYHQLLNEFIQEPDVDLHLTIADNKLQLNFEKSDETEFISQLTSESIPSIIVILNSLYSSISQNSNIHSMIGKVNNDTKPIEEVVIKNVDEKMLRQFLVDLKFNSSGANLSFTDLESDEHSEQNSLIKDIPDSSNKLTHFSIEDVIKHLKNYTKVSFKLNIFTADGKVMNSESIMSQIDDLNISLNPEIVKENTNQSNNIGPKNELTNSLNLNTIKEEVNFRINDLSDKIVDKSIANKNFPVMAKQHIDEKEVIQNQMNRKDSSLIKAGKILPSELRENQNITQNKFEQDKISQEPKKMGNDFFIDTEKNREFTNRLNLNTIIEEVNFRINDFSDKIVKIHNSSSKSIQVNKTEKISSLNPKSNNESNVIKVEIIEQKLPLDTFKNMNIGNELKQYSVAIKISKQLSTNTEIHSLQLPFVSEHTIKNLMRKNDKLKELREELSKIFIDADQVKIEDKSIANKNIPVTAKQHIDEKEVIQNLTHRNDSSSLKTGKIFPNELRENLNKTQNKFEPDKISNEPKKTENDFFIDTEKNKELTVEVSKKVNVKGNSFIEQQINFIDKNGLNEIIRSSSESKISRAKLLNSLEVFNKISELIQNKKKKSIEIRLNPPELGKMKVQVDYTEKKLYIRIEVENESAKQLLFQNLEQLKQTINQSGVQLKDMFVSLTSGEPKQQRSSDMRKRRSSNNSNSFIEDPDTEMSAKMMGYNTYDYLI